MPLTIEQRPVSHLERDYRTGCLLFTGKARLRGGYGTLGVGRVNGVKRNQSTHTLAWDLWVGIPRNGLHVCHHCDTPLCCEPQCLFLGTHADNAADMVAKGRNARGSARPWAKLTEDDVRAIRARGTESSRVLAAEFGVSFQKIRLIIRRESWTHVE